MGVVVLHFNPDGRLVLVAADGPLSMRQQAFRWLLQRYQRLCRSYRRFANGGIAVDSTAIHRLELPRMGAVPGPATFVGALREMARPD